MAEKWLSWGSYCTMLVESSQKFGSKNLHWGSIESDFLLNTPRMYGGGIGLIQTTSKNFEMLHDIVKNGFNIDGMPSGTIKNDLKNGKKSIDWFKSSLSYGGGLFNLGETQFIKKMLESKTGIKSQKKFTANYFTSDNKTAVSLIRKSSSPDKVKAFMLNMVVLYPSGVRPVIGTNPQTLSQAKALSLNQIGWSAGYVSRMDNMINYLGKSDFSKEPPVNIFDFDSDDSDSETPTNRPPTAPGDNRPPSNNNDIIAKPRPLRKITLDEGDFFLSGSFLYQQNSSFRMARFNDHLQLRYSKEEVEKEEVNKEVEKSPNNKPVGKDKEEKDTDRKDMIDEYIKILTDIPYNTLNYTNARPQLNPRTVGWADCSGYIGWGIRKVHPKVWNGGYLNTGTIYQIMKKAGYLKWEGAFNQLKNQKPERGDMIELSNDSTFGAGNDKHIIMYIGKNQAIDMNGHGNQLHNYAELIKRYELAVFNFHFANIIKVIK